MPLAAHDPLLSYFPRIDVTEGGVDRLLSDVIADIRDAKYRYAIERIREAYRRGGKHDEQYQALKGLLPYFTPGGRFRRRSSDGLILSSGIVQGDIDALNNRQLAWARDNLSSDPHTTNLFASPGGGGIKFAFAIEPVSDNDGYKSYFHALDHYVRRKYGFTLDQQCKSISHPCYMSYDSEAYFNPYPTIFTERRTAPQRSIAPSPSTKSTPVPIPQQISDASIDSQQLQWALTQLQNAPRHASKNRPASWWLDLGLSARTGGRRYSQRNSRSPQRSSGAGKARYRQWTRIRRSPSIVS